MFYGIVLSSHNTYYDYYYVIKNVLRLTIRCELRAAPEPRFDHPCLNP